ncbi:hypothetical protein [Scytonema sp. PCC 10023]|uniref:hypothetical protein n=1 Tax=Scytonema sp. PCC 10023 TaxID=1680591 RepID=UPI0039C68AD0
MPAVSGLYLDFGEHCPTPFGFASRLGRGDPFGRAGTRETLPRALPLNINLKINAGEIIILLSFF